MIISRHANSNLENNQLYQQLEQDAGLASWTLLKAHHGRGALIWVSPDLDLIKVGVAVVSDDKATVEKWMEKSQITPLPDRLVKTEKELKCLIAQPLVLIQEI